MLKKVSIIAVIVLILAAFYQFDLGQYLTLAELKAQREVLNDFYQSHTLAVFALYFIGYVIATAVSIPGAIILTLGAGAIFGFVNGLILASFASSIGASLAFLSARFVLRDNLERRFEQRLKTLNAGVQKDGAWYLFTLRLVPIFPFFLINLLMGLTRMPLRTYYWVSQIGMLAGTAVYVNAGTQLAQLESISGIVSPGLLASFALLGIFPLVAKWFVSVMKRKQVYRGWTRPRQYDDNVIVIGAGAGGLVSAYIAAAVKAKVTLIEASEMGGDCLNTGCVPSKALLHAAHGAHSIKRLQAVGINSGSVQVDFKRVMAKVQETIARIEPNDSVERYQGLGVNVIQGYAKLVSPWQVAVYDQSGELITTRSARSIIVATGASPLIPPIPGLQNTPFLTSETIWSLQHQPKTLAILGAGPIGCEFAQAFTRLGSRVVLFDQAEQILGKEDADMAQLVQQQLEQDGVEIQLGARVIRTEVTPTEDGGESITIEVEHADGSTALHQVDSVLVAVGRKPRTSGFGLEELGVQIDSTISTDAFLRTNYPNIFAVGDVAGPYQFTHTASHQAWYAAVNALFGFAKKFKTDYRVIPWATFTDPEIATVGLTEKEAQAQGIAYEVTEHDMSEVDRAITDDIAYGKVKVLTVPGKDKILGATIVGAHASALISEFVTAMKFNHGLNDILGTIHLYPSLPEANKYVAGNWKRAHAPQAALKWLERLHRWRRK